IVRPPHRGRRGQGGKGSLFTLAQLCGLGLIAGKLRAGACCPNCMRRFIKYFESMSEDEILRALQERESPWDEEQSAKADMEMEMESPEAGKRRRALDEALTDIFEGIAAFVLSRVDRERQTAGTKREEALRKARQRRRARS